MVLYIPLVPKLASEINIAANMGKVAILGVGSRVMERSSYNVWVSALHKIAINLMQTIKHNASFLSCPEKG